MSQPVPHEDSQGVMVFGLVIPNQLGMAMSAVMMLLGLFLVATGWMTGGVYGTLSTVIGVVNLTLNAFFLGQWTQRWLVHRSGR